MSDNRATDRSRCPAAGLLQAQAGAGVSQDRLGAGVPQDLPGAGVPQDGVA